MGLDLLRQVFATVSRESEDSEEDSLETTYLSKATNILAIPILGGGGCLMVYKAVKKLVNSSRKSILEDDMERRKNNNKGRNRKKNYRR